jgi:hypothetical protein
LPVASLTACAHASSMRVLPVPVSVKIAARPRLSARSVSARCHGNSGQSGSAPSGSCGLEVCASPLGPASLAFTRVVFGIGHELATRASLEAVYLGAASVARLVMMLFAEVPATMASICQRHQNRAHSTPSDRGTGEDGTNAWPASVTT